METLVDVDVVTERALFTALAPAASASVIHTVHQRASERGPWDPAATLVLPPVGSQPTDDRSRHLLQQQTSASPRTHIGARAWLPPKTPRSLMNAFPITADECVVVWHFLCDWVQTQVCVAGARMLTADRAPKSK